MRRGDIWQVELDPTVGHEQRGHRPVLIISHTDFNRATRAPIIVPITRGGDFARMRGFSVSLAGHGLTTDGVVRCDQPRAMDLDARQSRRIEAVPAPVLEEVVGKFLAIVAS